MTQALTIYFLIAIVLDHAHLVCPIWLGWSNPDFRGHMLARPEKFILLPALCLVFPLVVGAGASSTRDQSFKFLALVYLWWNAWHFGSQHFGVACLAGWRSGPRWLRQVLIIGATMPVMVLSGGLPLLVIGETFSLAHWATDIGLTAYVMRRRWWMFLAGVLCVGLIGFLWKAVSYQPRLCGDLPACSAMWSIPALVSLRYGLGFWHFLMSRWVWQLSDPQVRATVGKELFA